MNFLIRIVVTKNKRVKSNKNIIHMQRLHLLTIGNLFCVGRWPKKTRAASRLKGKRWVEKRTEYVVIWHGQVQFSLRRINRVTIFRLKKILCKNWKISMNTLKRIKSKQILKELNEIYCFYIYFLFNYINLKIKIIIQKYFL